MINHSKLSVLQIKGTSMIPFIKAGDYVVIEKCPLTKTRNGDIVAIIRQWAEDKVCVHRLVWKSNNNGWIDLLLKGDNISSFDRMCVGMNSEFLGRAVGVIKDKKVVSAENRWTNLIKLLVSFCLVPYQIIRRH